MREAKVQNPSCVRDGLRCSREKISCMQMALGPLKCTPLWKLWKPGIYLEESFVVRVTQCSNRNPRLRVAVRKHSVPCGYLGELVCGTPLDVRQTHTPPRGEAGAVVFGLRFMSLQAQLELNCIKKC